MIGSVRMNFLGPRGKHFMVIPFTERELEAPLSPPWIKLRLLTGAWGE